MILSQILLDVSPKAIQEENVMQISLIPQIY